MLLSHDDLRELGPHPSCLQYKIPLTVVPEILCQAVLLVTLALLVYFHLSGVVSTLCCSTLSRLLHNVSLLSVEFSLQNYLLGMHLLCLFFFWWLPLLKISTSFSCSDIFIAMCIPFTGLGGHLPPDRTPGWSQNLRVPQGSLQIISPVTWIAADPFHFSPRRWHLRQPCAASVAGGVALAAVCSCYLHRFTASLLFL